MWFKVKKKSTLFSTYTHFPHYCCSSMLRLSEMLAKLEVPHFIETAFVHICHCRLLSQALETVLRKMRCTHFLIFGLNCSGTVL